MPVMSDVLIDSLDRLGGAEYLSAVPQFLLYAK
jgi:hypothetical protein